MSDTLLIIQVVLAAIIVILVLLQKSSSMGFGGYSGSNESMFGAKGPANFLSRATMFIGFLFVVNTLILGYSYNQDSTKSILDNTEILDKNPAPKVPSIK
jgi:preprotein translocase subunit SecG